MSDGKTVREPPKARGRPRRKPANVEARRREILDAALHVFAKHGFEAARLEEVAFRAGVAKGTLYLYFPDKQTMFQALVRTLAEPIIADILPLAERDDIPFRDLLRKLFAVFRQQVLGTERRLVIRLLIAEGPHFPELAAFYHSEVVSHVMDTLSAIARQAYDKGEIESEVLARFPQLIAAPLLLCVVWDALYRDFDPLDVDRLLAAHAELLTGKRRRRR